MGDTLTSYTLIFEDNEGNEEKRIELVSTYVPPAFEEIITTNLDVAASWTWTLHRSGSGWAAYRHIS